MRDNVDVLEGLFRDGGINLDDTDLLESLPPPISLRLQQHCRVYPGRRWRQGLLGRMSKNGAMQWLIERALYLYLSGEEP